jgi:hypothetical protein
MSKEEPKFSIIEAELPKKNFIQRTAVYDELIEKLGHSEKGKSYKVAITGKKTSTLYQGLSQRLKGSKTMKLHKFSNDVFVEVLAEPKKDTPKKKS